MPLILLSGLPSSGKTTRSHQLIADFTSRISASSDPSISSLKVIHISDQTLGIARSAYDASRLEKDARALFASAVKRHLSRSTIVVADGLNYIKGYRYQLHCEAKACRTTSCVVQPACPPDECAALNERALASGTGGYAPRDFFDNLVYRHEEPNPMTRWDSPLFVVPHADPLPPCDAIWDALIGSPAGPVAAAAAASTTNNAGDGAATAAGSAAVMAARAGFVPGARRIVRPNAATVLKAVGQQGYLAHLERACGAIIRRIQDAVAADADGGMGLRVAIPARDDTGPTTTTSTPADDEGHDRDASAMVVQLPAEGVKGPTLQRLKRQFVTLNRLGEVDMQRVAPLFVDYLNDTFQA